MEECCGAICLIHETDYFYFSQKWWQTKSARSRRPHKKHKQYQEESLVWDSKH